MDSPPPVRKVKCARPKVMAFASVEMMRTASHGTYLDLDQETEQICLDRLGELAGTGGIPVGRSLRP